MGCAAGERGGGRKKEGKKKGGEKQDNFVKDFRRDGLRKGLG